MNGTYSVLPDYEEIEKVITKKKVEVTDESGNKVYEEDGKTVVTTEIEVETEKKTKITTNIKALVGSPAEKYAKAAKIGFTGVTPPATTTTTKKK